MAKRWLVHTGLALFALASMLVAAALCCPVLAAASTRTFSPFGVSAHLIGDYRDWQLDRELDLIAKAGASWVRIDVPWRYIEPADDVYHLGTLEQLDYVVAGAARRGMRVQVVVLDTPNWANGGRGPWSPPRDDSEFEEFMRFMAARYKGRITYWELGNEVNETEFWEVPRAVSARRYVHYLQAGYRGVKQGNPEARVISAGLAGSDDKYLEEMYSAGARGYFDILGVHAYTQGASPWAVDVLTPSRTFGGLSVMKATMERHGDTTKTIWITEVGWQDSTAGADRVSPERKGQYTYDAYKRLYRDFPYVETLFIYCVRDDGTSKSVPRHNYGLMERDYTPKPAYTSYREAVQTFARRPAAVSLAASRRVASPGTVVTFTGRLVPPNHRVRLQRLVGGRWVTLRYLATKADGSYLARVRFTARGTYTYRAAFSGDWEYRFAESRALRVSVR